MAHVQVSENILGSWSSFTMWVLGIKLRASVKCLYPLSHLTGLGLLSGGVPISCLFRKTGFPSYLSPIGYVAPNLPGTFHHLQDIYCLHLKSFGTNKYQISYRRKPYKAKGQGKHMDTIGDICLQYPLELRLDVGFSEEDQIIILVSLNIWKTPSQERLLLLMVAL